jgi:MFS transporter, DHA2 family, multidrug resistance protein
VALPTVDAPAPDTDAAPSTDRKAWLGLAVLALPTLLVSMDTFVMLLALPQIAVDLRATSTEQLWMLDIYGFMVAGLLITMGTLGDRIGRRRLLLTGSVAFAAASVLAAYASSPEMLIVARALLGIAGATLTPSTLALIMNLFHDAQQRARAIAVWAGCFVVGAIIGPIVGGVMMEHFWWGSVFLLGVPAMLLLLVAGPRLLPEFVAPQAGRLDLTSVALCLGAILPIIYGLKDLARTGPGTGPVVAITVGTLAGAAFLRRQRRLTHPLLDVRLFNNKAFSTTLGSMLALTMFSGGTMVFVAQYFQSVHGLSPLRSGLALAPGMVAGIASFQVAPILARRIRPAPLFAGGLAVSIAGLLLLTRAGADSGLPVAIMGFVIASVGGGPLVALGVNLVVGSVPPAKAGSAAGIAQTANEFGYALGVAVLGSIGTAVYHADMAAAGATGAAADSVTGAVETAATLPGEAATTLLAAAHNAYTTELHAVAAVSAIVLAGVAVLLVSALRHLPPTHTAKATEVATNRSEQ